MNERHPVPRCRRDVLFLVVAVFVCLAEKSLAVSTASSLDRRLAPDPTLVAVTSRPVVVRWEARARQPGSSFRLLRGAPGHALEVVAELPAAAGLQSYSLRDDAGDLLDLVYELRVTDSTGREWVLGRLSCSRVPVCSPALPPPAGPPPLTAGSSATPARIAAAGAATLVDAPWLASSATSPPTEPPVPPPRRTFARQA